MGEIADDLIDRMWDHDDRDDDYPHGGRSYYRNSAPRPPKKKKPKSDPNDRSTWKSRDYPEKTFDMSFFPIIPKKEPKPEPAVTPPEPSVWDFTDEDAPF